MSTRIDPPRSAAAGFIAALPAAIGLLAAGMSPADDPVPEAAASGIASLAPAFTTAAGPVQVFFGNLHSHTRLSDGQSNPREAYRHARDVAGIDFLAITEHNHAQAGRIQNNPALYRDSLVTVAAAFNTPGQFVALYGQEFSTIGSGNHANVLDVADVIRTSDVPNGNWRALLEQWIPGHLDSSNQPALLLLNHPAIDSSPVHLEYGVDDFSAGAWLTALDARAQLINIVNGPSHDTNTPGRPSESEFLRYLNLGLHVAPTADQDNHRQNWGSAAETRTGVVASELTKSAIMAALRARHVYATEDRNLRVVAFVHGQLMGSRITSGLPAPGQQLQITLNIHDQDEPAAEYRVDVYSDTPGGDVAEVVESVTINGNGVHSISGVPFEGNGQYLFIRLTQTDEDAHNDRAWLAPVWFDGQGGGTPPNGESTIVLGVDRVREEARITNVGAEPVDLTGWRLVSTRGNQQFTFPALQLPAGSSVLVVSGPGRTSSPPGILLWTQQRVWNDGGDPAELFNATGRLIAQTEP